MDPDILLIKLYQAGIRDSTRDWCKNYLINRTQKTLANGQVSDTLPVTCGVPQGSVLGPLLLLIFINDLQPALSNRKVTLYADDSVLYHSGINVRETAQLLQTSLDEFGHWCKVNKVTISTKKSKLMAFGTRSKVKKAKYVKIYLNGDISGRNRILSFLSLLVDFSFFEVNF